MDGLLWCGGLVQIPFVLDILFGVELELRIGKSVFCLRITCVGSESFAPYAVSVTGPTRQHRDFNRHGRVVNEVSIDKSRFCRGLCHVCTIHISLQRLSTSTSTHRPLAMPGECQHRAVIFAEYLPSKLRARPSLCLVLLHTPSVRSVCRDTSS